jgi:hypothetical protein
MCSRRIHILLLSYIYGDDPSITRDLWILFISACKSVILVSVCMGKVGGAFSRRIPV